LDQRDAPALRRISALLFGGILRARSARASGGLNARKSGILGGSSFDSCPLAHHGPYRPVLSLARPTAVRTIPHRTLGDGRGIGFGPSSTFGGHERAGIALVASSNSLRWDGKQTLVLAVLVLVTDPRRGLTGDRHQSVAIISQPAIPSQAQRPVHRTSGADVVKARNRLRCQRVGVASILNMDARKVRGAMVEREWHRFTAREVEGRRPMVIGAMMPRKLNGATAPVIHGRWPSITRGEECAK